MLNIHQLKKESLWALSLGSKSSNWSAPMVDMLGLVPPVPIARMYRAQKNTPNCSDDALLQSSLFASVQGGGLSEGTETASVNRHIPCIKKTYHLRLSHYAIITYANVAIDNSCMPSYITGKRDVKACSSSM